MVLFLYCAACSSISGNNNTNTNNNGGSNGGDSTPTGSMIWSTAAAINTGAGSVSAEWPAVAFDPHSGTAIAAWEQIDNGGQPMNINAAVYTEGSGWGTPTIVSIPLNSQSLSSDAQVTFDANGNGIVVYGQEDKLCSIDVVIYTPGTGWGAPVTVNTAAPSQDCYVPQVAVDASGDITVAWTQYDGTHYRVLANRFVAGTGWGTQAFLDDGTGDAGGIDGPPPRLVMDPTSGNAVVAWLQNDGTSWRVESASYQVGSGWTAAAPVENSAGSAQDLAISSDGNGHAIAVWSQSDAHLSITAATYTFGSGWGSPTVIDSGSSVSMWPAIAFGANGDAMALWMDALDNAIDARAYSPGSGWGTSWTVATDDPDIPGRPQVAFDATGNAITVWTAGGTDSQTLDAALYAPASGWDAASIIYSSSGVDVYPVVAVDSQSGHAVALWAERGTPPYVDIFASEY